MHEACAFCGEAKAGFSYELPAGWPLDAGRGLEDRTICFDCVNRAVWHFACQMTDDLLQCAGCGELWEIVQKPVLHDPDLFVSGGHAWICPSCCVTDRLLSRYDGPRVRLRFARVAS